MPNHSAAAVEPVVRALAILAALNLRPLSRLDDLHQATGLPKPTLVRLLQTLVSAGYVAHVGPRAGYRITERVLSLASGVRFVDRLVDAAMEPMSAFTRDHGWPLVLGKVRDGVVVVLHSTTPESHLSFEKAAYSRTFPLLASALGQAYMAFCPAEERKRLIRGLMIESKSDAVAAENVRGIEAGLRLVRRCGYAITMEQRPSRVLGIAVPIQRSRSVLGSLSLRFARSALTPEQAAARYLAPLTATARSIASAVPVGGDTKWPADDLARAAATAMR